MRQEFASTTDQPSNAESGRTNREPHDPSRSRVLAQTTRLTIAVLASLPGNSFAQAPATAGATVGSTATIAEAETILQKAEAVLKESDRIKKEDQAQQLIKDAGSLPAGEQKTSLLKKMAQLFATDQDTSDARKAALTIDQPAAAEQARTLVLIAKAELASGQTQQAWWSLHEAQQIALKLQDEREIVAVFREIGLVEKSLQAASGGSSYFKPRSEEVVATVLQNGLPPRGYQEIDIVRQGGGPLREPTVLIHTYYYNGKRVFQGPQLKGGPTIVQVTHPKCGCQQNITVNIPCGAPLIEYDDDFIRYYFPDVYVEIHFSSKGDYDVRYHHACNPYDRLRLRIEARNLRKSDSGVSGPNGTSNLISSVAKIGVSRPIELGKRLPVISDILHPSETRIPSTLREHSKVSNPLPKDLLKR